MSASGKSKKFNFKGVLDGFRSSVNHVSKDENSSGNGNSVIVEESLCSDNFQVAKTVRYGFPAEPTAIAYDPVQRLLGVGTKHGSLRIFGRPGVDCHMAHEADAAVLQIQFLVNEGALITACSDNSVHLWNYRQKTPEIVHSLKFQRERITCCYLPFQSKWLYVGSERGNVFVVNVAAFVLSGYIINWNKAIELSRKTHPGQVLHLSDNPTDATKLLIGYDSGLVTLWDLPSKTVTARFNHTEPLRTVSWSHEGRQFMCGLRDGSLVTWNVRQPASPASVTFPHAREGADKKPEQCRHISKLQWSSTKNGEAFLVFAGGLPFEKWGRAPSVTVMNGKNTTVLEMDSKVVDFVVLSSTPWSYEVQDPYAIAVLMEADLVIVDLQSSTYPCFENPYPMDVHESAVTACAYYADCPMDLIPAFYSVGSKQKRMVFSDKEWPISGGMWGTATCSYPELVITGHADGSVKFWDASAVMLQVLYKLRGARCFERGREGDEESLAVQHIDLCLESRALLVAGEAHALVFKFSRKDAQQTIPVIQINTCYPISDEPESPREWDTPRTPGPNSAAPPTTFSEPAYHVTHPPPDEVVVTSVVVRPGARKWGGGYQPDLAALLTWPDGDPRPRITAVALNTAYGLMVIGNQAGLAIVDMVTKICIVNMATPDIYGSGDPYQRTARSPKMRRGEGDDLKSPSSDQPEDEGLPDRGTEDLPGEEEVAGEGETELAQEAEEEEPEEGGERKPRAITFHAGEIPEEEAEDEERGRSRSLDQAEGEGEEACAPPAAPSCEKTKKKRKFSSIFMKQKRPDKLTLRHSHKPGNGDAVDGSDSSSTPGVASTPTPIGHIPPGLLPTPVDHEKSSDSGLGSGERERRGGAIRSTSETNVRNLMPGIPIFRSVSESVELAKVNNPPSSTDRRTSVQVAAPGLGSEAFMTAGDSSSCSQTSSIAEVVEKQSLLRRVGKSLLAKIKDKTDGSSVSRSRSSSISSLDNVGQEACTSFSFVETFLRKTDTTMGASLWVGTSLGSVIVVNVSLPGGGSVEGRGSQPLVITPSGTVFRLKGTLLMTSFITTSGGEVLPPAVPWRDPAVAAPPARQASRESCRSRASPTSSTSGEPDKHYAVMCSDKYAKAVSLPSQANPFKVKVTDTSFVVCAHVMRLREATCLACYVANGHISIFSLPTVRPLSDTCVLDPLHVYSPRCFSFSHSGHVLYFCSPSEIQKLTVSKDTCGGLQEMLCDLFVPRDTPEAPKQGFFRNLFGSGVSSVDRAELFGEQSSGKALKGTAKFVPGAALAQAQGQASGAASELRRARDALDQRGEKLGMLDQKTEQMRDSAEAYNSGAHKLMLKYKEKKWYKL